MKLVITCSIILLSSVLAACGGKDSGQGEPNQTSSTPSAFVYTANSGVLEFSPGSISAFGVTGDNGALTEVPGSPFKEKDGDAISIATNSAGSLVYVLSKINLQVFRREGNGQLTLLSDHPLQPFTPLRDIQGQFVRLHPNGRWLYILDGSSFDPDILVFSIVQSGADAGKLGVLLQELATVAFPTEADIFGNNLYVAFSAGAVSTATILPDGTLSPVSNLNAPGEPVSIAVHPSGTFAYVAFTASGEVEKFNVDTQNGALAFVSRVNTETDPTSIAMDPHGQFLYVTNRGSNSISGYRIAGNGDLTPLSPASFTVGEAPVWATFDPSGNSLYVTHNPVVQGSISSLSVNRNSGALTPQGTPIAINEAYTPKQVISIRP